MLFRSVVDVPAVPATGSGTYEVERPDMKTGVGEKRTGSLVSSRVLGESMNHYDGCLRFADRGPVPDQLGANRFVSNRCGDALQSLLFLRVSRS